MSQTQSAIDSETRKEILQPAPCVVEEMREAYDHVWEDDDILVLAGGDMALNGIAEQCDVNYGDVAQLMHDVLPDHIETGIGTPLECGVPVVVHKQ